MQLICASTAQRCCSLCAYRWRQDCYCRPSCVSTWSSRTAGMASRWPGVVLQAVVTKGMGCGLFLVSYRPLAPALVGSRGVKYFTPHGRLGVLSIFVKLFANFAQIRAPRNEFTRCSKNQVLRADARREQPASSHRTAAHAHKQSAIL